MKEIRPSGQEIKSKTKGAINSLRVGAEILLTAVTPVIGVRAVNEIVNPQIAEAAGKDCLNTQLDIVGFGYTKTHSVATRDIKQADAADLVTGSPEIGIVVVERPDDPTNPNSSRTEVTRDNLVNRGDYSDKVFKLIYSDGRSIKSNISKNGKEAVEVYFYAQKDPEQENHETGKKEKPRGKAVITCGFTGIGSFGRYAGVEQVKIDLNNPNFIFQTVAKVMNDSLINRAGQSAGLGPVTVDQTEVRRALKEYIKNTKTPTTSPDGGIMGWIGNFLRWVGDRLGGKP